VAHHLSIVPRSGTLTFKGEEAPVDTTNDSIRYGLKHIINTIAGREARKIHQLSPADYTERHVLHCPTSLHGHPDFKMEMYAPSAFHQLWGQFDITGRDLVQALTAEPLHEYDSPGASGADFYRSWDDQFFLKSVEPGELKFLNAMLDGIHH